MIPITRIKSIAAWVLYSLLAVLFAIQGILKLSGSPGWISRFNAWGYPDNFHLVIGVVELAGAVLLLVPRLSGFGALMLMAVMIGAAMTHLLHGERQLLTTVVLMALLALAAYTRRSSFARTARTA